MSGYFGKQTLWICTSLAALFHIFMLFDRNSFPAGSFVLLRGPLAGEAIYGICAGGNSATGGYQEDLGIAGEV